MKKYTIKATKKGKEWKKFMKGVGWLNDETSYRLELEIDGFWPYLRSLFNLFIKRPCAFEIC